MSKYIVNVDNDLTKLYHSGIKGMKWGRRRFQNPDGTLTEAGRKRYAEMNRDIDATTTKSTGLVTKDQGDKTHAADVNKAVDKMVSDDLTNTKTVLSEGSKATNAASKAIKSRPVNVKRMDLSNMSDDEMRSRIQRELLESQYDKTFNKERKRKEKNREKVAAAMDEIGTALTITGSALSIALAIRALKS